MSRTTRSLCMLAATAVLALAMIFTSGGDGPAAEASFVTVRRGKIADVAAITGRLAYADETLTYAAVPGLVAQVYVRPGDRVVKGEALLRLGAESYEAAVSAWIAAGEAVPGQENRSSSDLRQPLERTVVRAPMDATVRQVLTAESAAVSAGTPVVLLSSNRQEVRCAVAEADVRRVQAGMWARLSVAGEDIDRIAKVLSVGELEADPATGQTFSTVILLPDQHIDLPAGAAVDAEVYIAGREDVPVLPVEAITERGTVWWVTGERCTEIPVEILLNDEMHAWVSLPEGTTVALGEFVEGQRIREVAK